MEKGKVKYFNEAKGFGFIIREGQDSKVGEKNDIFVHATNVQGEKIRDNDLVEFDVEETPRGLSAKNVKKVTA
jgi:CspA family cold shock protein